MSNNVTKFEVGKTVFVFKRTGVCDSRDGGTCRTSEKVGLEYPDIEPTEPLIVKAKHGSVRATVIREGRKGYPDYEVVIHKNHINKNADYYAGRGVGANTTPKASSDDEKAKAKAALEKAAAAYQALLNESALPEINANELEPEQITDEERDEVAQYFKD